jgi:hypothetical protein
MSNASWTQRQKLKQGALFQLQNWTDEEVGFAMSAIAFGRELNKRPGLERKKVRRAKGFRGIKLRYSM